MTRKLETGVDTDKLRFAAGPSLAAKVSIVDDLQKTDPSRPLASAFPRAELGDSGTRMLHGIITEEYNPQLQGIQAMRIYDEMRKGDATVSAALRACTLPIRRAEWFVKPVNDTPEAIEQAEFVEHAIFDWIDGMTWDDILRQALLMTAFGVMLFEKVYGTKDFNGKTYVTLKKLAPRLPKSILMWELVDGTFGIQQIRQDGVLAQIPGSKLLIFVNDREGDNWWGTAMIRSAYKHWYHKDNYYKIDGVAAERQGLGIPKITMPQGYTANDEKKAEQVLSNLRANEQAWLILPPGYEAEFMDMGAKSVRDLTPAIEHHDMKILQSVLAQFLQLGASKSGSGSRALSQDHSDLFLKSIESIADTVQSVFNRDLIHELVDLNFDGVEDYPVLNYSGITKADVAGMGTALSQLTTSGFLNPTDDDQQYVRALLGLPARTQEDIDAAADGLPSEQDLLNEPDGNQIDTQDDGEVEDAADNAAPAKPTAKANKTVNKATKKKVTKTTTATPGKPEKPVPAQAHSHHQYSMPRTFDSGQGFMSWRPLTMAETSVNWSKLQDNMDALEADFTGKARDLLNKSKDDFMASLLPLLTSGDTEAIGALTLDFEKDYTKLLTTSMKEAYKYGKNHASSELGIDPQASTPESVRNIELTAQTIAAKTVSDLETAAKLSVATVLRTGKPTLQAAGDIDSALEEAITKTVQNTSDVMIGQGINNGRNDTFDRNDDKVYALQRSELLDKKTCNFCLSMDSRVVEPGSEWAATDIFHSNCRGIWVAILKDEANPPAIDGVPESVSDHWGGETNSLVQPKTPIPKPGSLAERYVKSKQAAKK